MFRLPSYLRRNLLPICGIIMGRGAYSGNPIFILAFLSQDTWPCLAAQDPMASDYSLLSIAALNIRVCALWSLHVICAHSSCLKTHSEKDRGVVTCVLHWWRYENSFLTGDCSFLLGCQWLSGNIPRSESIHITPQNEQCMARPGHPELDSFTSDCFSETLECSICSNVIVKNIHPTSC